MTKKKKREKERKPRSHNIHEYFSRPSSFLLPFPRSIISYSVKKKKNALFHIDSHASILITQHENDRSNIIIIVPRISHSLPHLHTTKLNNRSYNSRLRQSITRKHYTVIDNFISFALIVSLIECGSSSRHEIILSDHRAHLFTVIESQIS